MKNIFDSSTLATELGTGENTGNIVHATHSKLGSRDVHLSPFSPFFREFRSIFRQEMISVLHQTNIGSSVEARA
jgi:hypothetical protein